MKLLTSFRRIGIYLFLFILLYSCSIYRPGLPSFVDPAFQGKMLRTVVVEAVVPDFTLKKSFEAELVPLFKEKGCSAMEGSSYFPPTRDWTDEQIHEILLKNHIESYLSLTLVNQETKEEHVPLTTTTTREKKPVTVKVREKDSTARGYRERDSTVGFKEKTSTVTDGGYTVNTTYKLYQIKVIDVASGTTIWIASYKTSDDYFIHTLCQQIITQLGRDSLIPSDEKK